MHTQHPLSICNTVTFDYNSDKPLWLCQAYISQDMVDWGVTNDQHAIDTVTAYHNHFIFNLQTQIKQL